MCDEELQKHESISMKQRHIALMSKGFNRVRTDTHGGGGVREKELRRKRS